MDWLDKAFWSLTAPISVLLLYLIVVAPSGSFVNEATPTLPWQSQLYINNYSFVPFTNEATPFWQGQIPGSIDGLVITTNLEDGSHYWADISMFHQLRCLIKVREVFVRFLDAPQLIPAWLANTTADSEYSQLGHCFDYIRQGIMCFADGTYLPGPNDGGDLDGDILWRQCRESSLLYDWAVRSAMLQIKPPVPGEKPSGSHGRVAV